MAVAPKIRFKGFDSDWEERSFSELYLLNVRKNDLTYGNGDIISVANMYYAPNPTITNEDYLRTYNVLKKGDIAFEGHSNERYPYGRFVENDIGDGIVSHIFQVFSPIVDLDVAFWKHMINNEHMMRPILADSTKTSTMMREIVPSRFLKKTICVPCLEEQKKVGQLLGLVDRLIKLYEKVIPIFDLLVKSRFTEMFGTPTVNEKQWPTKKMKEIAPSVQADYKPMIEGNWLLNLDAIQSNSGEILFKNRVSESELNGSIMVFSSDHVLYSKLRPYLNKVVVPDESGYGTTELIPLLPDKSKMTRLYLAYFLKSDAFVSRISSAVAGTKMPRVSMDTFWKFEVPVPPIDLQHDFEIFVQQVDKSKFNFVRKYEALKKLRESLICGMLIPVSDHGENIVRL